MSIQALYVDRGPTVCFTAPKQSLESKFSIFVNFRPPTNLRLTVGFTRSTSRARVSFLPLLSANRLRRLTARVRNIEVKWRLNSFHTMRCHDGLLFTPARFASLNDSIIWFLFDSFLDMIRYDKSSRAWNYRTRHRDSVAVVPDNVLGYGSVITPYVKVYRPLR